MARPKQVDVLTVAPVASDDARALCDPGLAEAVRAALKSPELWAQRSPRIIEALAIPSAKIAVLGGTDDDLLAMLLDSIDTLSHPSNRNLSKTLTPLQHVDMSLDIHLEKRRDALIERGRDLAKARNTKSANAHKRAEGWLEEVTARPAGLSKSAMYLRIARREKKSPAAVEKAIARLTKNHRHSAERL